MKRILYILSFTFVYLIISAKSCNQNEENRTRREQKSIQATRDSIISLITSDAPSQLNVNAYEASARTKFLDFIDYLKIIDTVKAPAFRELTKKQILKAFISSDCIFQFKGADHKNSPPLTLLKLIESSGKYRNKICHVLPDSVHILEPMHQIDPETFKGKLAFSQSLDGYQKPENIAGTIEIWLVKKKMVFDRDTIKAWTVSLGNFYQY